jgi:hypothetical protein
MPKKQQIYFEDATLEHLCRWLDYTYVGDVDTKLEVFDQIVANLKKEPYLLAMGKSWEEVLNRNTTAEDLLKSFKTGTDITKLPRKIL